MGRRKDRRLATTWPHYAVVAVERCRPLAGSHPLTHMVSPAGLQFHSACRDELSRRLLACTNSRPADRSRCQHWCRQAGSESGSLLHSSCTCRDGGCLLVRNLYTSRSPAHLHSQIPFPFLPKPGDRYPLEPLSRLWLCQYPTLIPTRRALWVICDSSLKPSTDLIPRPPT